MSTTASGIPRVKAKRKHQAKPLEATAKRTDERKKSKGKSFPDDSDEILNAWRKK